MKQNELEQRLKALMPGAGFSIWSEPPPFPPEADVTTMRTMRSDLIVCWDVSNLQPCPTQIEIDAVTNLPPVPKKPTLDDVIAVLSPAQKTALDVIISS